MVVDLLRHCRALVVCVQLFVIVGAGASAAHAVEIDIVVAYTTAARDWAAHPPDTSGPFDCNYLHQIAGESLAKVYDLTGLTHWCPVPTTEECVTHESTTQDKSAGVHALIDIAMAEINQVYRDSGVVADGSPVQFRLADKFEVTEGGTSYLEGLFGFEHEESWFNFLGEYFGGLLPEVAALRNRFDRDANDSHPNRAILNMVHQRRFDAGGDIVVLLRGPTGESGGLGAAAAVGSNQPQNAFVVVTVDHATAPFYTFSHEVSHILGAHHFKLDGVLGITEPIASRPHLTDKGTIDAKGFVGRTSLDCEDPGFTYYETIMGDSDCQSSCATDGDACCDKCVLHLGGDDYRRMSVKVPLLSTRRTPGGLTVGQVDERNNARVAGLSAATVADFGTRLHQLPTIGGNDHRVGIDFGPAQTFGFDVAIDRARIATFDYRTYDPNCRRSPGDLGDAPDDCGLGPDEYTDYWNNVADDGSFDTPRTLYDVAHNDSRLQLRIVHGFHGFRKTSIPVSLMLAGGKDEMPIMAMSDGLAARRLFRHPRMEITGLDDARTYSFRFFSSSSRGNKVRKIRITLTGARDWQVVAPTHGNMSEFIEFSGIRPQGGTIVVEVAPDKLTVPILQTVNLNAMEIRPE